jgi:polysaccharide deacetylase 2 family uncharacterized protein YibQ
MAQGILSGIALGAVFSIGVAGIVSVVVPMESRSGADVSTAEPVGPAQPPVLQPSVSPTPETTAPAEQPQVSSDAPVSEELPTDPAIAAPQAPDVGNAPDSPVQAETSRPAAVTLPQSETAALAPAAAPTLAPLDTARSDEGPTEPVPVPQPQAGRAADLTEPRPLPEDARARAREDDPVLPNPQALAPMIPDDSQDTAIAQEAADPVTTVPDAPERAPADTVLSEAPPERDAPSILTPTEPVAERDATEDAESGESDRAVASVPRPRVLPVPGAESDQIGTDARPRIGRPASTIIDRSDAPETTASTAPDPLTPADEAAPVRRFAQPFENSEGKPLMSIVLMDTGVDLDATEIGLPALASFPYPISFAVDMGLPDAAARMQRYRAEGFDVLAIVDLPPGAQPTDAEVSLSVALDTLDEVVGVLEGTGEGLQASREVADQVTGILKASGHGLVAQSRGLNSMPKLAVKEGVPAAAVFRDFDSEGQAPRVIRRFLDQAAFKAGQEGGVIMLGRLRPETIEALLVWGLADRAGAVALAPVSAVLLAQ